MWVRPSVPSCTLRPMCAWACVEGGGWEGSLYLCGCHFCTQTLLAGHAVCQGATCTQESERTCRRGAEGPLGSYSSLGPTGVLL